MKSWLNKILYKKKLNEWVELKENNIPHHEVIALGFQNEIIIGYINNKNGHFICENDNELLVNITHFMKKPQAPKR